MEKKNKVWGYCRVSRPSQNIERQIRNIKEKYPTAIVVQEAFTGRSMDRPEWTKLYDSLSEGDVIVFDSVSRMSRNAELGFNLYQELYQNKKVRLVFLKEPHVDTDAYQTALAGIIMANVSSGDEAADKLVQAIMDACNDFMMAKVKADIVAAFEMAQMEVDNLSIRTSEGMQTAKLNGKQIGQVRGAKLNVKKAAIAKEKIKKYSKDFSGNLTDIDCIKLVGVSRPSYYKYKRELKEELSIA